ncbi:hypothetical protein IQ07DRAFT_663694, partial [Pyrenochaeta sp. DS3sAY3a]
NFWTRRGRDWLGRVKIRQPTRGRVIPACPAQREAGRNKPWCNADSKPSWMAVGHDKRGGCMEAKTLQVTLADVGSGAGGLGTEAAGGDIAGGAVRLAECRRDLKQKSSRTSLSAARRHFSPRLGEHRNPRPALRAVLESLLMRPLVAREPVVRAECIHRPRDARRTGRMSAASGVAGPYILPWTHFHALVR